MKPNLACLILYILLLFSAVPMHAQANGANPAGKNEVGLVIGATELPSVGLAGGGTIHLNSSLALGAEYDRQLFGQSNGTMLG